jgi:hypothetical protein
LKADQENLEAMLAKLENLSDDEVKRQLTGGRLAENGT